MGNGKLEGKLVVCLWWNVGVICYELKLCLRGVGIFYEIICFGIRNVFGVLYMVFLGLFVGLYCSKGIYVSVFLIFGFVVIFFVFLKLRYVNEYEWWVEDKWNGFNFFVLKILN